MATTATVTSSPAGFRASGRRRRLSATSATMSRIETVNQAAFAAGSGTNPAGIARTANAGRYLY
jgi:hypothetical protein